jgi:hypothetical protein
MLLAIDPSSAVTRTGWAIFDDGRLVACGKGAPPPEWLEGVVEAVLEHPVIYPGGRTANPNDIVKLAVSMGEMAGALEAHGVRTRYVEPRAWKGTIDPAACCRRVWRRLDEAEAAVAEAFKPEAEGDIKGGKDHVLDAIGIGLQAVGRWRV